MVSRAAQQEIATANLLANPKSGYCNSQSPVMAFKLRMPLQAFCRNV
jgi:hypothetical protein